MYEFNAQSLEILLLIQNDNSLQKESRLEGGQLPNQFVKSQTGEENIFLFVLRVFCLHFFSFYLFLVPANLFQSHSFCEDVLPRKCSLSDYFCKQFVKEEVSNECDFATEVV